MVGQQSPPLVDLGLEFPQGRATDSLALQALAQDLLLNLASQS
jgi:hypothetical protein